MTATITYTPLTQAMIDEAAARNRRIELEGPPRKRLKVEACEGQNYAWAVPLFRGRKSRCVTVSVLPEGQPARIIR